MLRPSVRVTRKVILGFKWTNPKLVRALTLQGKRKSSFHLSPSFKHANRLPPPTPAQGARWDTEGRQGLWVPITGSMRSKKFFRFVCGGGSKIVLYRTPVTFTGVAVWFSHQSTLWERDTKGKHKTSCICLGVGQTWSFMSEKSRIS